MHARHATALACGIGAVLLFAVPAQAASVSPGATRPAVADTALVEKVHRRGRVHRYARKYRPYRYRYARRHYGPYVYGYSSYPYYGSYYPYGYGYSYRRRPGFGLYFGF